MMKRPSQDHTSNTLFVPKAGLEPAQLAPHAPETCVSTNFTTSAKAPGPKTSGLSLQDCALIINE